MANEKWGQGHVKVEVTDLSKDFKASAARLQELKAGRDVGNIPLDDEYWQALKKHQKFFNKKP